MKKVDTTKKSNIKCEHCEFWDKGNYIKNDHRCLCIKKNDPKAYWNRCKDFQYGSKYLEGSGMTIDEAIGFWKEWNEKSPNSHGMHEQVEMAIAALEYQKQMMDSEDDLK